MRIYVDTSVFGGCYDPEFEIWSNRIIDFFIKGKYKAVISEVSVFELKYAPSEIRLVLSKIVTEKSLADTQHIAIATVQQVDLFLFRVNTPKLASESPVGI